MPVTVGEEKFPDESTLRDVVSTLGGGRLKTLDGYMIMSSKADEPLPPGEYVHVPSPPGPNYVFPAPGFSLIALFDTCWLHMLANLGKFDHIRANLIEFDQTF
jgi:hypothetical protein